MNINAIATTPLKIPMPAQPKVEQQTAAATATTAAAAAKPERMLTAAEEYSKKFYSKQEEPWNSEVDELSKAERGLVGPRPTTKNEYLDQQYKLSYLQLENQYSIVTSFMKELHYLDPDVAQKNWSYTLGPNGEVKVLDPKGNLTDAEVDRLTEAMNNYKQPGGGSFKENMRDSARTIMRIVDHDTKKFGGKYHLDLLNFHKTIDYGKINFIKEERNDDWAKQVFLNGETKEPSQIDVRV